MLNINELIINYIILNYQINKRVTHVESCYLVLNWVMFKFVISNPFIIHVIFGLMNIIKNLLLTRLKNKLPSLLPYKHIVY